MTWFLRKSLRLGPLRLNLSKRGVGASIGVKGARIGVDAAGKPYAAGGRGGLYFRQRLGGVRAPHVEPESAEGSVPPAPRGRSWWWLVLLGLVVRLGLGALLVHETGAPIPPQGVRP